MKCLRKHWPQSLLLAVLVTLHLWPQLRGSVITWSICSTSKDRRDSLHPDWPCLIQIHGHSRSTTTISLCYRRTLWKKQSFKSSQPKEETLKNLIHVFICRKCRLSQSFGSLACALHHYFWCGALTLASLAVWKPRMWLHASPEAYRGLRRHMHGIAGSDVTVKAAQATPHRYSQQD